MKYTFKNHTFFLSILILISLGYYFDALNADVMDTVSDQWNFVPVAIKMDHPDLFRGDLFLDSVQDVKYYTPIFINGIRFFTFFTNDNYFAGLNLFNLIINLTFSFTWYFLFFQIFKDKSFAFLFSMIIRGLMWLPGYEVWGAGPLWLALPRTAFISLLPIVFILLLSDGHARNKKYLAYFILGLITNFHPLSGLGIFIAVIFSDFSFLRSKNQSFLRNLKLYCVSSILFTLGCANYVYTYFTLVLQKSAADPAQFRASLNLRIGEMFTDPLQIVVKFTELKWLIFILTPYILLLFIYKRLVESDKRITIFACVFSISILLFSICIVPFEMLINNLGVDLNMSFQLVRNIKFIVIPVFILYAYFIFYFLKLREVTNLRVSRSGILSLGFILVLIFSRFEPLRSVPLIGDDFIRGTLPNVYSLRTESLPLDSNLLEAMNWINLNIHEKARFVGPACIRSKCRQSVIFDSKGASMLIEGNPNKFAEWGRMKLELDRSDDQNKKLTLYRTWGTQYLLTQEYFDADLIFQNSGYRLYEL